MNLARAVDALARSNACYRLQVPELPPDVTPSEADRADACAAVVEITLTLGPLADLLAEGDAGA